MRTIIFLSIADFSFLLFISIRALFRTISQDNNTHVFKTLFKKWM